MTQSPGRHSCSLPPDRRTTPHLTFSRKFLTPAPPDTSKTNSHNSTPYSKSSPPPKLVYPFSRRSSFLFHPKHLPGRSDTIFSPPKHTANQPSRLKLLNLGRFHTPKNLHRLVGISLLDPSLRKGDPCWKNTRSPSHFAVCLRLK